MSAKGLRRLGGVLGICVATATLALESDSKDSVYVDSDTATYDDKKGTAVYTGKVHAVQGSLVVDAHEMTVYLQGGKVDKLLATGAPVHIVQKQTAGAPALDAHSQRAEYYPDQYRLILIGNAVVLQGGNTYQSDRIEYDTRNAVAIAGDKGSSGKRVHTVIGPKSN